MPRVSQTSSGRARSNRDSFTVPQAQSFTSTAEITDFCVLRNAIGGNTLGAWPRKASPCKWDQNLPTRANFAIASGHG